MDVFSSCRRPFFLYCVFLWDCPLLQNDVHGLVQHEFIGKLYRIEKKLFVSSNGKRKTHFLLPSIVHKVLPRFQKQNGRRARSQYHPRYNVILNHFKSGVAIFNIAIFEFFYKCRC